MPYHFKTFGTVDYLDDGDTLAVRHNLRIDAMRYLDAAAWNDMNGSADIARRQRRAARNLMEDARLASRQLPERLNEEDVTP